jgi:D-amino-acid dehydrogenase
MGVGFNYNASISSIQSTTRPNIHIQGSATPLDFDHIVVCTGSHIPPFSHSTQISVPMVSVASYSLTARVKEDINAPRSAIYTPHDCTSIVRLGKRVRVSFGAELGTRQNKNHTKAVRHMYHALQQAFPGGADYSNSVQIWKGNMAVTADGLPIIGGSTQPGVWFNLGHGPNGWGMACGAAMCLSAAIGNRAACIDLSKVSPLR